MNTTLSYPFKVTWSCGGPQPHLDLFHTPHAKPCANLPLAAPIFPWVTGSTTQRLLLINPWHAPHKAFSGAKYNHWFNEYQNKTQKSYDNTGNYRAMANAGGKQITVKTLKGCSGQAGTQLFLTSLSSQKEENVPPLLSWGPSLQTVTHSGWQRTHWFSQLARSKAFERTIK